MAIHLIPAMFGLLSVPAVAIAAVALVSAVRVGVPDAVREVRAWVPAASQWAAALTGVRRYPVAAVAVAAVVLYLTALAVARGTTPPMNVDTLTFHLPGVAAWIDSGSIWQIDQFAPDQAHGYYPNGGNLIELAAVLPWDSDFAIRLLGLPFVALAGIAVYASGRELGAGPGPSALAGAAMASMPVITVYAVQKPVPDIIAVAGLAAGVLFGLRAHRTGDRWDLILAASALGIAFATKWYGVAAAIALLAVWMAARLIASGRLRHVVAEGALFVVVVLAIGGVWLLRNLIESGNPVYPATVSVGGVSVFDAPPDPIGDAFGHTVASYLDDPSALGEFLAPALLDFLAVPGLAALVAAVLGVVLLRRPADRRAFAASAAAMVLTAVYLVTPYGALGPEGMPFGIGVNLRYLTPALVAAFPVAALLLSRSGRAKPVLTALVLIAVLDALRRGTPVDAKHLVVAAVLAALTVAGLRAAAAAWRMRAVAARGAVVAAALIAVAVPGYVLARKYTDDRYQRSSPALAELIERSTDASFDVGLAGSWPVDPPQPVLPAFGPRYGNDVSYIGSFEEGMLRPLETERAFIDQLDRHDPDLLLVGREALPLRPDLPEALWARRAGYRTIAADDRFVLMAAPDES